MSTTEVVVGRIGKAHGLRGEVAVEPRTDEPERRFGDGARLRTRAVAASRRDDAPAPPLHLTVAGSRWHSGRLLVSFAEADDRTAAEGLRGLLLEVDVDPEERPEDPEEFYDHQLVGLPVLVEDGRTLGELEAVLHGPAQDLLSVRTGDGREVLVPFVSQLVPVVDVPGRRILVVDVPGLLRPEDDQEPDGDA